MRQTVELEKNELTDIHGPDIVDAHKYSSSSLPTNKGKCTVKSHSICDSFAHFTRSFFAFTPAPSHTTMVAFTLFFLPLLYCAHAFPLFLYSSIFHLSLFYSALPLALLPSFIYIFWRWFFFFFFLCKSVSHFYQINFFFYFVKISR